MNEVFFIDNNTGYAVGENGTILKTTDGGLFVGIGPLGNSLPDEFSLSQNYPNPFNGQTQIGFNVPPGARFVKLSIFDVMGHEIANLVNEKLNPGTYQIDWNAGNLSSGSYFCRLTSGDFTHTKKMILTK